MNVNKNVIEENDIEVLTADLSGIESETTKQRRLVSKIIRASSALAILSRRGHAEYVKVSKHLAEKYLQSWVEMGIGDIAVQVDESFSPDLFEVGRKGWRMNEEQVCTIEVRVIE